MCSFQLFKLQILQIHHQHNYSNLLEKIYEEFEKQYQATIPYWYVLLSIIDFALIGLPKKSNRHLL